MMKNIFVSILMLLSLQKLNAQTVADSFKVLNAKDLPTEELIPPSYLRLEISFVSNPPFTKGFWFFKKEKLSIKMKFTNVSNVTYYMPSVFYYYNPQFILKKKGEQLSKTRIIHINPVIDLNFFQKLNSKESYEIVIDVQERYKFDITNGDYALTTSMDSEFGKLIINGKEFPIWHGKIESNSLTFSVN